MNCLTKICLFQLKRPHLTRTVIWPTLFNSNMTENVLTSNMTELTFLKGYFMTGFRLVSITACSLQFDSSTCPIPACSCSCTQRCRACSVHTRQCIGNLFWNEIIFKIQINKSSYSKNKHNSPFPQHLQGILISYLFQTFQQKHQQCLSRTQMEARCNLLWLIPEHGRGVEFYRQV